MTGTSPRTNDAKLNLGNVLVTGGLGFIGSHFVRNILESEHNVDSIINVDYMGHGSNEANLKDAAKDSRYRHINADISGNKIGRLIDEHDINAIVNFAAETHVDRSIKDPARFINSNINGTFNLLECCRSHDIDLYVQISTDEVYGDAENGVHFDETASLNPSSPYSASKASADMLVKAYQRTYGIKTLITRCSNNFGPYQFPEKFIPKMIIRALKGLPIPVYGDGRQTREWLYVEDHVEAILQVITGGRAGETYNISTGKEFTNIEVIRRIGEILNERSGLKLEIEHVPDRPGHDKHYALDVSRITSELDWHPKHSFDDALVNTINWYLKNGWWWNPMINDNVLHSQPWTLAWK